MFKGDEPAVGMVFQRAVGSARRLGHPRVGVEHLLVGLAGGDDVLAEVLARHGATSDALEETARAAAPLGAGAAADAESLALIGVDLDRLLLRRSADR
jgi:ATP-dependent Clp protease ATP-binding subunit ClpA